MPLTFQRLHDMSDPKRITRSDDVTGPPLDIEAVRDAVYYAFNFRSHATNTTGLRHRGYIKFLRPRSGVPTPLMQLNCVVDCGCPDFRYRWAWANKQRGASVVGPQSLNQAINRAPRITNPTSRPGLCKHILACKQYIEGLMGSFRRDLPDDSEKLRKLIDFSIKRWANFDRISQDAKNRNAAIRARMRLRNRVGPDVALPPETPVAPPTIDLVEPAQIDATLPAPKEDETSFDRPRQKGRVEAGGYDTVAQRNAARYSESRLVVRPNIGQSMSQIKDIVKLVEGIQDDYENDADIQTDFGADVPDAAPELPPSEPPIEDSALGAQTEEKSEIDLLAEMRDLLSQLVTALAPSLPAEEGGAAEDEAASSPDAEDLGIDLPPSEDVPETAGEDEEEGGDEDENDDDERPRNSRPVSKE